MIAIESLEAHLQLALRRAPQAHDPELARQIREEGQRLVFLLNGLVRATRLYDIDDEALGGPAEELAAVLAGLVDSLGDVQLSAVEDEVYVNDVRLRVRPAQHAAIEQLRAELARHDVGGLVFHRSLDPAELRDVAHAIGAPAIAPHAASLRSRLAHANVEIVGLLRHRAGPAGAPGPRSHAQALAAVAAAARAAAERVAAGWGPDPLPLRRAVILLVEELRAAPERAAFAPFVGAGEGSTRHAVSVCQIALVVGRALGLGDVALADLGVAALLHEVGGLAGGGGGDRGLAGVRLLLRQRGFGEARIRRLRAVLEVPRDHDDATAGGPSLFARILRVAHEYDLLTAAPGGAAKPLSPPAALARLWAARGTRLDPDVVAVFAREVGAYPPGTLLELANGAWAMVVRAGAGRERWRRPTARVFRTPQGVVRPGETVDVGGAGDADEEPAVIEPWHLTRETADACRAVVEEATA